MHSLFYSSMMIIPYLLSSSLAGCVSRAAILFSALFSFHRLLSYAVSAEWTRYFSVLITLLIQRLLITHDSFANTRKTNLNWKLNPFASLILLWLKLSIGQWHNHELTLNFYNFSRRTLTSANENPVFIRPKIFNYI